MEQSVPSLSIFAFPMGRTKSGASASSDSSNSTPYISSFSRNTTGLGSRIAAASRPLASSQLYGERTLRPGTLEYHAAKHWECCAPTPAAAPLGPRNTIGTGDCPPDMYNCLAAEL